MPFERWSTGEDLFSDLDKEHDLLDRDLRPFLEECDQLQGLQIITGTDDAWGGFAARYLDRIRDELGKTSTWVWGLEDGGRKSRVGNPSKLRYHLNHAHIPPQERQILQTANIAQSLYQISPQASLYIPLTTSPSRLPSYLSLYPASKWHTSALQALALESLTLATRLRSTIPGRASLDEYETVLSNDSTRKIATAHFSAQDPAILDSASKSAEKSDSRIHNNHTNGSAQDSETASLELDVDLQPDTLPSAARRQAGARKNHVFSRVESLRGKWRAAVEIEDLNLASRDRYAHGPRVLR